MDYNVRNVSFYHSFYRMQSLQITKFRNYKSKNMIIRQKIYIVSLINNSSIYKIFKNYNIIIPFFMMVPKNHRVYYYYMITLLVISFLFICYLLKITETLMMAISVLQIRYFYYFTQHTLYNMVVTTIAYLIFYKILFIRIIITLQNNK